MCCSTRKVEDNQCVGAQLQWGESEMSHANGSSSPKYYFLLFLKASVMFTLRIALASCVKFFQCFHEVLYAIIRV